MVTHMKIEELLKGWHLNAGATAEDLRNVEVSLEHLLPFAYENFLRMHNGGEGFIGDNYLILWRSEELSKFNREYEVDQYAPGLLLFGSNGGGEGYAFDTRVASMSIARVPFIGMDLRYAIPVATDLNELFVQLAK
jgi:hypothetical protein